MRIINEINSSQDMVAHNPAVYGECEFCRLKDCGSERGARLDGQRLGWRESSACTVCWPWFYLHVREPGTWNLSVIP